MQLFQRTCRYERMNLQRIGARAFVIGGGIVWIVAALGAPYGNRTISLLASAGNAFGLLALTVAVFALGMFYERLAAVLLVTGSAITVVYGLIAGWEPGVWTLIGLVLVLPMLVAGVLFWLAARMQNVCELQETSGTRTPAAPAV